MTFKLNFRFLACLFHICLPPPVFCLLLSFSRILSKLFCEDAPKFSPKRKQTKPKDEKFPLTVMYVYIHISPICWESGNIFLLGGQATGANVSLRGRAICRKSSALVSGPQTFPTCHADPFAKKTSESICNYSTFCSADRC